MTLGECDDEPNNSEYVQGNAKCHNRCPEPRLRPEDTDDQNANPQLWQRDTEKSPSICEDHPESSGRDGVNQIGIGDASGRPKRFLKGGDSDNVEYLLKATISAFRNAISPEEQGRYPRDGDDQIIPPERVSLQHKARIGLHCIQCRRGSNERP